LGAPIRLPDDAHEEVTSQSIFCQIFGFFIVHLASFRKSLVREPTTRKKRMLYEDTRVLGVSYLLSRKRNPFRPVKWLSLMFMIWIIGFVSFTLPDPTGRYSYKPITIDDTAYEYPLHLTTSDIADNNKVYNVNLIMHSRSFSAQYLSELRLTQ